MPLLGRKRDDGRRVVVIGVGVGTVRGAALDFLALDLDLDVLMSVLDDEAAKVFLLDFDAGFFLLLVPVLALGLSAAVVETSLDLCVDFFFGDCLNR